MKRMICRVIGTALVLMGTLAMLTPIPFGLILFLIGLMFLIPSTPAAARPVRWMRARVRPFDTALSAMTVRLPVPYRRVLRQTEVGAPDYF